MKQFINKIAIFFLFLITITLFAFIAPIGFAYTIVRNIFKSYTYLFFICIGIDKLGNTIMATLFNSILIKQNGYQFGNVNETISSVIGKNLEAGTLTFLGKSLNALLNFIQKNHSINSIENTITIPD